MLSTLVVVVALVGIAGTLALGSASKRASPSSEAAVRAQYIAHAGVSDKLSQMIAGNLADLGTSLDPIPASGGSYWVAVENLDSTHELFRLTARARFAAAERTIQTVVRSFADTVVRDALFAGNSSGDGDYVLTLGGAAGQADHVEGDVYSGNAITVTDGASVTGVIRARGRIVGVRGSEAISRSVRDFAGLRLASASYVDVGRRFASSKVRESALGGVAGELPKESVAHLFRMNPSDRTRYTDSTAGDDYFLEDPYEPVTADANADGSDATRLALGGLDDRGGAGENGRAFAVDGDLWIQNAHTHSFRLGGPPDAPRVLVVVVQGNIHIADNLFCRRAEEEGIVLIALKNPARADSGNIILGDPDDGTLREVDAFLLAENDVLGCKLGLRGAHTIAIHGSLTAGNQVRLQSAGSKEHVGLTVEHDDRLVSGRLALPGLAAGIRRATAFTVLSWKETEAP